VGELVAAADEGAPRSADGSRLPLLTGFENHGGVTTIGSGASPLARVITGVGNGGGDGSEGAWTERVVGTYLHGPVLARNVALADLLLEWALASRGETLPGVVLDDVEESALRADRLTGVGSIRSARSGRERRRRR
jgi:lipid II isoglutaminyl synthase (glutamine-hydrolysing)